MPFSSMDFIIELWYGSTLTAGLFCETKTQIFISRHLITAEYPTRKTKLLLENLLECSVILLSNFTNYID